jgi:hypothetical protein
LASNAKKKTTMAKLNRERRLLEKRAEKQARKQARKAAAARGDGPEPEGPEPAHPEPAQDA